MWLRFVTGDIMFVGLHIILVKARLDNRCEESFFFSSL